MQPSMKQQASQVTLNSPFSVPFKWEVAPGKPLCMFTEHQNEVFYDGITAAKIPPLPPPPLPLPPKLEFQQALHSHNTQQKTQNSNLKDQSVTRAGSKNQPSQKHGYSYYSSSCGKLDKTDFPYDDGDQDVYEEKYKGIYEDGDGYGNVYEDDDYSSVKLYVFSRGVFNQRFFFEKDSPRTFLSEKSSLKDLKHSDSIDSWHTESFPEKESSENNEKNNNKIEELDEDEYYDDTESSDCSSPWQPFIYTERTSISPNQQQSSTYGRGVKASLQSSQQTDSHKPFERDEIQQHATDILHEKQTRKKPSRLLGLDRASRAGSDAMGMFHESSLRQKSPSRSSVETKGQATANMLHERSPLHLQHSRFCTSDAAVAHVEAADMSLERSSCRNSLNEMNDSTANDRFSWRQHSRFSKQNEVTDVTDMSCERSPCQKPSKVCETDENTADAATATSSQLHKAVRHRAKLDGTIDVANMPHENILYQQSSSCYGMDIKNLAVSENGSATGNSSYPRLPTVSKRDGNAHVAASPVPLASSTSAFPKSCRTIRSIHHRRYESAPSLYDTEFQQSLRPKDKNGEEDWLDSYVSIALEKSDASHDGESGWQISVRRQGEDIDKDKDQNFNQSKSHGSCVVGRPVSWQSPSVLAASSPWILALSPDNSVKKSQDRIVARVTLQSLLSKVLRGRKKSIEEYSHGDMWSPTLATYLRNQREEEMLMTSKHGDQHENLVCKDRHLAIRKNDYLRSYTDPAVKKHVDDGGGDYDEHVSEKTKLSLQKYMRSEAHEKSKFRNKVHFLAAAIKVLIHKQKSPQEHKNPTCLKINLNVSPFSTRLHPTNSSSSTRSDKSD